MSGVLRAFAEWYLERTDPATGERKPEPKPPTEPVRDCNHTVLAIDDDPIFLRTVTTVLRKRGFSVLAATNGAKGLNLLCYAPGNIEVVLLDYGMPHLNGAETLGHLRKLNPKIKVIALTAVDITRLPKSFHEGVDKFIQKPFDARKVIDAILSLVEPGAQPATLKAGKN